MGSMEQFQQITNLFRRSDRALTNLAALGLPEDAPRLRIVWMYPDALSLHGGRGDLMALVRFATMARLPVELRRVEQLSDPIGLDQADFLYFCAGDLTCAPDIARALMPQRAALEDFAARGKLIMANGSSGAILARELVLLDGTTVPGLGLLGMRWTERATVKGDDLWLDALDGIEVVGNEIKLADVTLDEGQQPFATVRYGRGNCGDGREGAVRGGAIYTTCLGPVLVRNPALAMALLQRAAEAAGLPCDPAQFQLDAADLQPELQGLEESKAFITKKINHTLKQR